MGTILNNIHNGDLTFVYLGLLGILVGMVLSYKAIKEIIGIYRTPTSVISALLTEGQVEVVGKADCEKSITSPISHKPCVLWQVKVQDNAGGGRSSS